MPRWERGLRTEGACPSLRATPSGGDGVLGPACTRVSFFFFLGGRILGRARREGGKERDDDDTKQAARGPGAAGVGAALSAGLRLADSRWAAPGESLCCKQERALALFLCSAITKVMQNMGCIFLGVSTTDFLPRQGVQQRRSAITPHLDNNIMSSVRCICP